MIWRVCSETNDKFRTRTIYSETGMVQANMDGVVAEPDPTVLMMMIRTVARFRGRVPRARA